MRQRSHTVFLVAFLSVSIVAATATFVYQGWYFLVRLAILLPLIVASTRVGKTPKTISTVFSILGMGLFGGLIAIWSIYPVRRLIDWFGGEEAVYSPIILGLIIATFIWLIFSFGGLRWGLLRRRMWFLIPSTVFFLLVVALSYIHSFVWPASIGIEFISYLGFFAALWPLAMEKTAEAQH